MKIFMQKLTIEREMIFSLVTGVVILKFNKWTIIFLGLCVLLFLISILFQHEMIFSIIAVVKKPKNTNDYFFRLSCLSVSGIRFTRIWNDIRHCYSSWNLKKNMNDYFPGFRVRLFLVSDLLRLFRNCDDRPDVPDALQLLVHLAASHGHRLAILNTLFLDLKDLFLILIFLLLYYLYWWSLKFFIRLVNLSALDFWSWHL